MSNLVMFWNEKAVEILKDVNTNPGHDTRRFAILQIAIHDALNSVKAKFKRYVSTTAPDPKISTQAAVTGAAYIALHWAITDVSNYNAKLQSEGLPIFLFDPVANYTKILGHFNQCLASIPGGLATTNGLLLGINSAAAILADRANDKSNSIDIASNTPVDGTLDGKFKGTYYDIPPAPKNKLLAKYGDVKLFALNKPFQFRQDPIYNPASDKDKDKTEVRDKGKKGYPHNQADLNMMEVWSNNKQHIVWNNIAYGLLKAKNKDEWESARLFALIHTAMADGAISMFKDVYHFYKWRPVTALNITPVSPPWKPYKEPVPRVPEYPSTFGILGGAAGQILENVFTDNTSLTITIPNTPTTISYPKISAAVNDIANATVYCGWNFRKSTEDGIKQGRQIGNYVFNKQFNSI